MVSSGFEYGPMTEYCERYNEATVYTQMGGFQISRKQFYLALHCWWRHPRNGWCHCQTAPQQRTLHTIQLRAILYIIRRQERFL